MFQHIIVSNIMRHLDKNDILTDSQHGFRPRRSCEMQLLTLTDQLIKSLDLGRQHDLPVLDFSNTSSVLIKLEHGIEGRTLNWIRAFPTDRLQRVIVEGVSSEPAQVKSGMPQGSVLGPVLFLILIISASIRSGSSFSWMTAWSTEKSGRPKTDRSSKKTYSSYGNGKSNGACPFTQRSAAS